MSGGGAGRVLVLGGGTNGLAAATRLARGGRRVTLLERRAGLGGLAAGEEFHPGFRTTGLLHDGAELSPAVARALELERHGLVFEDTEPPQLALEPGGRGLVLERDPALARGELAARVPADADAYGRWRAFLERVGGFVRRVLAEPPPRLDPTRSTELLELVKSGVALRRLGEADVLELLRVAPMCAADWVKDSFEDPLLQAAVCAPALHGTWLGPWSAGGAAALLARESTRTRPARGGPAAIARALEAAARAAGVELRVEAPVRALAIEGGAVRGAELADDTLVEADLVLSTLEPRRTLLELVPRAALPPQLEDAILSWRTRGTTAKVHLALDGPLEVAARPGETFEHLTTGATVDELERAFDGVKYGELPERPALDVRVPSVADPSLAPAGRHVVSILAHWVPREPSGGWTAAARDTLEARVLDVLAEHVPTVRERVIASEVLSPADIEERFELPGGHVHHGEHALDQLLFLRPTRECAHYATPIAGLYLGGAGSHPGGGVTCAPGWLAAGRLLADRRR